MRTYKQPIIHDSPHFIYIPFQKRNKHELTSQNERELLIAAKYHLAQQYN